MSKVITQADPINKMLEDRGKNYGAFPSHARITQQMKEIAHSAPSWSRCSYAQKEAIDMNLYKLGRILNGDPNYLDSWVDIIGYVQLVVNDLKF